MSHSRPGIFGSASTSKGLLEKLKRKHKELQKQIESLTQQMKDAGGDKGGLTREILAKDRRYLKQVQTSLKKIINEKEKAANITDIATKKHSPRNTG